MNAHTHSKFYVSLADLIKADLDYYDACIEASRAGLPEPAGGSPTHYAIMAYRCTSLAEIRDKLEWMQSDGGGLTGCELGYMRIIADIDKLLENEPHGPHNQAQ